MSIVTPEELKKIAGLARLSLRDEESEKSAQDISGVLEHFEAIRSIDTSAVPPAADASGLKNVTRSDNATPELLASAQDIMDRVPHTKDGYVQVAGVFSSDAS